MAGWKSGFLDWCDLQEESQYDIGDVKCPFGKREMSLEEV